jgi:hypothetical protein
MVTAAPAAARRIAVDSAPVNEADRRSRCRGLLEEATLRRLSANEAAFFKKECR